MKKHIQYAKYLIRHKWYVTVECWKMGLFWRGLVHDFSKISPDEWRPYAEYFYGGGGNEAAFNIAWLKHIHRNKHHWQYWVLREDSGETIAMRMPTTYALEMLADWRGAGKAIHGHDETLSWYENNKHKMLLHDDTRHLIETLLLGDEYTPVERGAR